jgi:hypothetical protein
MRKHCSRIGSGCLAGLALIAVACTSPEETHPAGAVLTPGIEKPGKLGLDPVPAAALDLPNGNTLDFHDFGSGALLIETGKAGNKPYFSDDNSPDGPALRNISPKERLAAIWKIASPAAPLPKALLEIQKGWKDLPAMGISRELPVSPAEISGQVMEVPAGRSLAKTAAPNGCNNGCCDYEWLKTLNQCKTGLDFSWFNYNFGWSKVTNTGIDLFDGLVCAASGSSVWKVSISDGKGGSWTLKEGYYKRYWWLAGVWSDENASSSVNTVAAQALHTYCGAVSY